MWLFSKEKASFPYEVDATSDEVVGDWILRKCKNAKTGVECSAWVLDCSKGNTASTLERGKAVIKRMKTLRHPNFVTYIDSLETDNAVTLITETAIPLSLYLRRDSDSGNLTYLTSWGLYEVAKALDFFNKDIKLQHNNVRMTSVFVTPAGDWKLGGLDFVQSSTDPLPVDRPTFTNVYWPHDKKRVDSWGLGCLIWEVYNPGGLTNVEQLRRFGNIPQALIPQYSDLIHPKAIRRSTVSDFIARATAHTGFFDNFYVKTLLFLEEIQIKDKEEKLAFLAGLADNVNTFPDDVAKFKILPHLMHFLQYGGAGAEVLTPLLRLGKLLDTTEFEQKVLPCLIKLFSSPDRATRVRLLEQLPTFVEHLPEKVVNEQIFPPVSQGFVDTNPVVREATIRAMVPLSEKLNSKCLNDTLPRSLTQLQVKDEQGGIRANASICLVKIAGRMSAKTRQGPLLNTFLKCTRDPYPPARRMAVTALATTLPFYTLKDTAGKVLPCLAFLTVDPVREVRDETFKSLAAAVSRLERASVDSEVAEREDQVANSGPASSDPTSVAASAGSAALAWTNWAVSALSAKFAKSSVAGQGGETSGKAISSTSGGGGGMASSASNSAHSVARKNSTPSSRQEPPVPSYSQPSGDTSRDFAPDRGDRKLASAYNWDGGKEETDSGGWDDADFADAKEEQAEDEEKEEEEDAWMSLESTAAAAAKAKPKPVVDDWNSDDFFTEASRPSTRTSQKKATPASFSSSNSASTRGAMKLGKKLGGGSGRANWSGDAVEKPMESTGATGGDDWGSSWSTTEKPKKPAPSSFDDWSSSWSTEKNASDDWGASWSTTEKQKKPAAPVDDDWGSSWSTEKRTVRASPASDARGSSTLTTDKKKSRTSPAKDDWGSSWSTGTKGSKKSTQDNDGWDAW